MVGYLFTCSPYDVAKVSAGVREKHHIDESSANAMAPLVRQLQS